MEKRIRKLIEEDKYLSLEGKEAYAQYRVEQEQKALVLVFNSACTSRPITVI